MTEKHKYNLEHWKLLIQDQKSSGMKIKEWCRANGCTKDAYYYWLHQLRREMLPAALDQLVPPAEPVSFADVTPVPEPAVEAADHPDPETPSAILRKNGLEVRLFPSASPELVRMILESVKNA